MTVVGDLVRARREARGWPQARLAILTGLSQTYLSRLERGEVALPRKETLEKLGRALGIGLPDFYRAAGVLDVATDGRTLRGDSMLGDLIAWIEARQDLAAPLDRLARGRESSERHIFVRDVAMAWADNLATLLALLERADQDRATVAPEGERLDESLWAGAAQRAGAE